MNYRKNIRLKTYDYTTNGYYFVTICTAQRKSFLEIEVVRAIVAAELALLPNRFLGLKVDFDAIMSNHVHMILALEECSYSLSRIVQAFKSITTIKAKQALPLQIKERMWQPNYYEHVIRSEKALSKIREYIFNNPIAEQIKWEEIYDIQDQKAEQALSLQAI